MDWRTAIRDAENRLRQFVAQRVLNVVEWSATTVSSADGSTDAVAGLPADEDSQIDVLKVQHFGFISIPVKGGNRLFVCKGTRKWSVGEDGAGYAPTDLEEGEVAVYSKAGAIVELDKDGNLYAVAASGKKAILVAGSLAVTVDDGAGSITVTADASGNQIILKGDGVTATMSSGAFDVT